jgi:hypothetical protein
VNIDHHHHKVRPRSNTYFLEETYLDVDDDEEQQENIVLNRGAETV